MVFAIASSGSFESLAIVANVATLTLYGTACLAAISLMRRNVRTEDPPFVVPAATLVAIVATVAVLIIMSSATVKEFGATGLTLAIASILYLARRRTSRVVVERSQLPA